MTSEQVVRTIGGLCELAGLVVVAYSIEETRQWLRRQPFLSIVTGRLTVWRVAVAGRGSELRAVLRRMIARVLRRPPSDDTRFTDVAGGTSLWQR